MTPTPTIQELADQVSALQRDRALKDRGLHDRLSPADYQRAVAQRQSQRFLEQRERANRGSVARTEAASAVGAERRKIEDKLAGIARERAARLEQLDQSRRDTIAHFDTLEARPNADLAALRESIDQAGKDAEAEPVQIQAPAVRLARDDSDLEKPANQIAREIGRRPKAWTEGWH